MLEQLFELAFKYRPVVFEQGEFAFNPFWPPVLVVAVGLLAAASGVWAYLRVPHAVSRPAQAVLLGLRLATVLALVACLSRPVLILRAIQPQRNLLAVLVDDSRSMAIRDVDSTARGAFVATAFKLGATLRSKLGDRFALRFFRFSAAAERTSQPDQLTYAGTRSEIGQALAQVADELAGLPASGIVLVTDGADTSSKPIADTLRAIRAKGLPVFTVGVGRERFPRDIQIGRVEPPARVLKGTTLVAEVLVDQTGFAGARVPLVVEDEGQRIGSQEVTLSAEGEPTPVRVQFTLAEAGPRLLRFLIPPLDGEQVSENNAREALVVVEDRREKLLYVEGEPRYEMKFLRRAVAADRNLQVVTLQRTAERKFLRLDIDEPMDLAGGFPKTREELFAYRGLLLGSIEAAAFTPDQLQMIAEFVSLRGGGLLALGGRRAFSEGGYAGTPVADALPVHLAPEPAPEGFVVPIRVRPTRLGERHVVTRIAETEQTSLERWATMPELTVVNLLGESKPGAAVLLSGTSASRAGQVALAYHRFGAGRAIAFPVQDSWLWQMHADMPVEDLTHETLWRRLLRWVIEAVPDQVEVRTAHDSVEPGDTVEVAAVVRDAGFLEVNDASVRATVLSPSGRTSKLPLTVDLTAAGEYRGTITTTEPGLYEVRVEAVRGGERLGGKAAYVRAAPSAGESFDAVMRASLLRRIADETGGRFYTADTAASLPDDITYLGKGVTAVEEKDLWDMPAVLLLLIVLVGSEWVIRRRQGLA